MSGRRWWLLGPAIAVLLLGIWSNSGTLASYAVTHDKPMVLEPCQYLVSIDHSHFAATYKLLAGAPRNQWEFSVVLRRMLYPIVAFPFMTLWGYETGGFFFNLLLYALTLVVFFRYTERTLGDRAACYGTWLLATYPGITYWAGLPYAYAIIVTSTLFSFACLLRLDTAERRRQAVLPALRIGVACTAYDLMPFVGAAAVLILCLRRRWLLMAIALPLIVLPSVIVNAVLAIGFDIRPLNSNTEVYLTILRSYIDSPSWGNWQPLLAEVPAVTVHNFFFSNFVFLPALFLLLVCARLVRLRRPRLTRVEASLLCAISLVFLVSNLAPAYSGWQMRGFWIARLYQPVFVVFLSYVLRVVQSNAGVRGWRQLALSGAVATTVALNAGVVFGPLLWPRLVEPVYYNFYRHSEPGTMLRNIERYGQRPIGFCERPQAG